MILAIPEDAPFLGFGDFRMWAFGFRAEDGSAGRGGSQFRDMGDFVGFEGPGFWSFRGFGF